MKIITKIIHASNKQAKKDFSLLKEYCINLPKFFNLGKALPSLDLYFMT